jgi:hypothetical protein
MTPAELDRSHRYYAVECNNRAWDLCAQDTRSAAEAQEMLLTAYASAYHWGQIGQAENQGRAACLLAHVHALLGQGAQAKNYAESALAIFTADPGEDWDLAFVQAELALAAQVLGDAAAHAAHYAQAKALGEALAEEGDREVFFTEFARIPKPA